MKNVKCYITDEGDPSVGIFPVQWEIECPFAQNDIDDGGLEWFRTHVAKLYGDFSEGYLKVEFDFEMIHNTD